MHNDEARRVSRLVGGFMLLTLGGIFVLQNAGVLHAGRLGNYWPLLLVWLGLSRILSHGGRRLASGVVILAVGVAFQLDQLGTVWLRTRDFWPILLVLGGLALVTESLVARRSGADRPPEGPSSDPSASSRGQWS